jgi:hypothetical protein
LQKKQQKYKNKFEAYRHLTIANDITRKEINNCNKYDRKITQEW